MRSNLSEVAKRFHGVTAGTILTRTILTSAILAGLTLAAACGTTTTSNPAPSGTGTTHQPTSSSVPVSTTARIGADCGKFSSARLSSMHSMSLGKALKAAAHNPQLSLVTAAAAKAGLTADLNSMHAITLFVPANTAFMHLSMTTAGMLRNRANLTRVLRYHVVGTRINPVQMAHGAVVPTLEGSQLRFSKMGSVYEVNGATILCGNIQTANATIYIINKVLTPPK